VVAVRASCARPPRAERWAARSRPGRGVTSLAVASLPARPFAKRYADQGVVFVACDLEESKAGVEKFLARKKLEIACAIVDQKFTKPFGVGGIPHTVMVGKDGMIQKVHIGFGLGQEKHFEADLRAVLGLPKEEPKPASEKPAEAKEAPKK